MKKILAVILLGAVSAVSLDVGALVDKCLYKDNQSDSQKLIDECLYKYNQIACQKLIDTGSLPSLEECDGRSCGGTGVVYVVAKHYFLALPYLEKACDLKNGGACYLLGSLYQKGVSSRKQYFKRACDLGEQYACDAQ